MISGERLTKRYGAKTVVDAVSLDVKKGEVVGLLGENGAGKSTTLRMLTGFIRPTEGTVRIAGVDMEAAPERAKRELGYMPETAPLYPDMRVHEILAFRGRLLGLPRTRITAAIDQALMDADLVPARGATISRLSKGYRQRVALAYAVLGRPAAIVLDEPTAGLDPNQIDRVRALVSELSRDHAVLLSTHALLEVDAMATRVVVMHRGKIVSDLAIEGVREKGSVAEHFRTCTSEKGA